MRNENFTQAIDFLNSNENILDINNWESFNIDFSNFDNEVI
jgi:hypothetical protein